MTNYKKTVQFLYETELYFFIPILKNSHSIIVMNSKN